MTAEIQIVVHQLGGILWRNNSGATRDVTGREVRYGLGNISKKLNSRLKSSDYIGMTASGRLLAIEVKPTGWTYRGTSHEIAQLNFIREVQRRGGVAGFAVDVFDVIRIIYFS